MYDTKRGPPAYATEEALDETETVTDRMVVQLRRDRTAYRRGLIVGAILGCLGTVAGVIIDRLLI